MAILVTGGAGYIGSHTVSELIKNGEDVVIIDNLEKGHKSAIIGGRLYIGDLMDDDFLNDVFMKEDIEAVIHFAAYSLVGESVTNPLKYYNNNVVSTLKLLNIMKEYSIDKIVFSSSAAVYGEPESTPIIEGNRTLPTNPYGETKLAVEKALKWADSAYGIRYASLRYFNAAGAHPDGIIGEDHTPESHLIPIILQAALGQREQVEIFGDDYSTLDGTCIRDYVHVIDLASAHILALKRLRESKDSSIINLGNGKGFSVKEVLQAAREVTGIDIKAQVSPRRAGDPAILVASSQKAKDTLSWKPEYDDLNRIIETAWNWHRKNPQGFKHK